ncbi:hypothetical protein SFRURICE_007482 [Spodoptera frugiperda]|nr:hypothetical protein SFRURICE_007482 [Spodoptera frugiperda]
MWLKPKICRKSLFHTNEVAGYNKSVKVTQNGEIKLPREDRHPRGRSRGQKLVKKYLYTSIDLQYIAMNMKTKLVCMVDALAGKSAAAQRVVCSSSLCDPKIVVSGLAVMCM